MHAVVKSGVLALGLCGWLLAAPAFADIKSFNVAMKAKDYAKAAAEAAATWPTLDKSREDLAVIAREFGFAAYLSGDFAAARMFGEAAVLSGAAEEAELRLGSETLFRLAEHKLAPSEATRDKVYAALSTRATLPSVDLVSYFAADTITAYDFLRGDWKDAIASASTGSTLSANGGALYLVQHYRFDLFGAVARYMVDKQRPAYDELGKLKVRIVDSINAAATDDDADPLTSLYWDTHAWHTSLGTHLSGRRKLDESPGSWTHESRMRSAGDRAVRLLDLGAEDKPCQVKVDVRRPLQYPSSALYKGLLGTVILRVDLDAEGKALNPEILGAVPDKVFGDAVLKGLKDLRHLPGEKWGSDCRLERTGRVITFTFTLR
jgi:TonB family protein